MAYGARLESVLGASPRGFESPILRQQLPCFRASKSALAREFLFDCASVCANAGFFKEKSLKLFYLRSLMRSASPIFR